MERDARPQITPAALRTDSPNGAGYPLASAESVLTDAVLDALKKQSPEGCLLCSFDIWDEEEWD